MWARMYNSASEQRVWVALPTGCCCHIGERHINGHAVEVCVLGQMEAQVQPGTGADG